MLLWAGLTVSRFGYRFFNLAILWFVMQETGSALSLGMTVLCFTVPTIIIEPLAGVAADRFDKKKIMVLSDIFTGSTMLIIAILMIYGSLALPLLYALLVCLAASMALFNPSANSSIPLLVQEEQLTKANSLNQLSTQGSIDRICREYWLFINYQRCCIYHISNNRIMDKGSAYK